MKALLLALLTASGPASAADWVTREAAHLLPGWVYEHPDVESGPGAVRVVQADGTVLRDDLAAFEPRANPKAACRQHEISFTSVDGGIDALVADITAIHEGRAKTSSPTKGKRHGAPSYTFKVETRYGHPKTDEEVFAVSAEGKTLGIRYRYEHESNPSTCRGDYLKAFQRITASLRPSGAPVKTAKKKAGAAKEPAEEAPRPARRKRGAKSRGAEAAPREDGPQLKKAATYVVKGNLTIAEDKFREASEKFPKSLSARLGYSILLKLLGRKDEARREMAAAKAISPDIDEEVKDLLLQADLPPGKGVRGKAKKDARLSIADGLIREAKEDTPGALRHYNHAVSTRPDLWLGWALRGMLRVELYDCPGARNDIGKAVDLNPSFGAQASFHLQRCPA